MSNIDKYALICNLQKLWGGILQTSDLQWSLDISIEDQLHKTHKWCSYFWEINTLAFDVHIIYFLILKLITKWKSVNFRQNIWLSAAILDFTKYFFSKSFFIMVTIICPVDIHYFGTVSFMNILNLGAITAHWYFLAAILDFCTLWPPEKEIGLATTLFLMKYMLLKIFHQVANHYPSVPPTSLTSDIFFSAVPTL